jgi:ADP-heptose:LPS heptosyltransferase
MKLKNILVIRMSAIGDVAMSIPVLQQVLQQNPSIKFTVLTLPFLAPLFEPLERVSVVPIYKKEKHKGITGLFRLCRQINRQHKIDAVADLHDVLRSKLMRIFFTTRRIPIAVIDKGRKEKKLLTAKNNKQLQPLKTTFQRYADVFAGLGLKTNLNLSQNIYSKRPLPDTIQQSFSTDKKNILVAPFAGFAEKMYPLEKTKLIVQRLTQRQDFQVYLLGAGPKETAVLSAWEKEIHGIKNLAGKFSFREELDIISNMDLVVSMDSANMHLASLFNVPVVSIWGATHPYAGFYGWKQSYSDAVQLDLYCRPCSVFGNRSCYRGDHACMQQLPVDAIIEKVNTVLNISNNPSPDK